MSAELRNKFHLTACLPKHLICRGQPYCKADDITVDLLRFADKLELIVKLLNDRSFNYILAKRCLDGMPEQYRHAKSADLCRVYPVASDLRKGFKHGCDLDACLHQLIAYDKSNVACSDH